jgi:hypothetical protein
MNNNTELNLTRSQTVSLMFLLARILFDKNTELTEAARSDLNSIYGRLVNELELTKD